MIYGWIRKSICLFYLSLFACSGRINVVDPDITVQPLIPDSPTADRIIKSTVFVPVNTLSLTQVVTPVLSATPVVLPTIPTHLPATDMPMPLASLEKLSPGNASSIFQYAEIRFSPWSLVMALAWSPDGRWLTASPGNKIAVFSTGDFNRLAEFEIGALTHSLVFSPDSSWLAAGSRDGFLRVWKVNQGFASAEDSFSLDVSTRAHAKGTNSVTFDPGGGLLASGGNDAVARFWAPGTGELLGMVVGGTFAVPAIAFDPTGSVLAVINGDRIRLREVQSGAILGTLLAENSLYSLAYSPDGRLLAVGDSDNHVLLWDPSEAFRTGRETYPDPLVLLGHNGRAGSYQALIWRVAFSPDGRLLASAGGDGTLRLWDVSSGTLLAVLAVPRGGVTCLAFHPDGHMIATGGLDGVLRLWATGGGSTSTSP